MKRGGLKPPPEAICFFSCCCFQWDEGGGGGWLVWGRTGFLSSEADGVVAGLLAVIPLAALVPWLLERTIEPTPVAPPPPTTPPPTLPPSELCNGALDDVNVEEELEEEALGTRILDTRRPVIELIRFQVSSMFTSVRRSCLQQKQISPPPKKILSLKWFVDDKKWEWVLSSRSSRRL